MILSVCIMHIMLSTAAADYTVVPTVYTVQPEHEGIITINK